MSNNIVPVALSYQRVRGLYFLAVVFVATIPFLELDLWITDAWK